MLESQAVLRCLSALYCVYQRAEHCKSDCGVTKTTTGVSASLISAHDDCKSGTYARSAWLRLQSRTFGACTGEREPQ